MILKTGLTLGPQHLVSKIHTAQQSSGLQCHLAPVTSSCAHSSHLCSSCASLPAIPPWLSPVLTFTQSQLTQHVGRIQMAPSGRDHMPSTAGTMTSCYTTLLALNICCWILLPTTSPVKWKEPLLTVWCCLRKHVALCIHIFSQVLCNR